MCGYVRVCVWVCCGVQGSSTLGESILPLKVLPPRSPPWRRHHVKTSWRRPATSAPRPRSGRGASGNRGPTGKAVGGSTEGGNHDGNRGPALPLPPPPPPHLRLLGRCCKPLQRGCTAGCREGCRAGSRREAGVGLGWWEYLGVSFERTFPDHHS